MTLKAVTPVLFCLACVSLVGAASAQGLRLTPTPSMIVADPKASTPASNASTAGANIQADYIVAVVNSEPVTNSEVRTRLIRFERRLADQRVAMPPRAELMREVLDDVINEKIQLQLARESEIGRAHV